MRKRAICIIFVCLVVLLAIAIAVVASIATSREHEGTARKKQEDFFYCKDLKTKLVRSQVEINFWFRILRIKSQTQTSYHSPIKFQTRLQSSGM